MGKKFVTPKRTLDDGEKKCFVPSCSNKIETNKNVKSLQFFQVPDGIEGLFWEKAVKIRQRKYDKMIDLLSSTDYSLGLDDVKKSSPKNFEYCCEVHFDIDVDIERIVNDIGFVEYKVKPGVVPQIKPKQNKRLCDESDLRRKLEDDCEMTNDIIKSEESISDGLATYSYKFEEVGATTDGYLSIADIYKLPGGTDTPQQQMYYEGDHGSAVKYEEILPMLPFTIALMKRKSPYYMGLQQNHFLQLLQLAHQNQISDIKVMITLRKIHLNEEFEVLGDLFDLDKNTTESYFNESKHKVINLVDILATTGSLTNFLEPSPVAEVKYECATADNVSLETIKVIEPAEVIDEHDKNVESSESDESSSSSYIPTESDPDVLSEDFSCSDESTYEEKTVSCELCDQSCTPRGLKIHHHATHSLRLYLNKTTCGLCFQKFQTNLLLRQHQIGHHDGKANRCDVCNQQFLQKRQIVTHILMKHAQVKTYLCDECGLGFPFPNLLTRHLKEKHWNVRSHQCHLCDKNYKQLSDLQNHVRSIHTNARPFLCVHCGKTFSRKNVYRSHSRVHALDKFECNICSKQFSFKANLVTHKRNIHKMNI